VWYISLEQTSISANTAIYNSNSIFVFVFSIFLLKERVTALKIVAVTVCLGGVVVITIYGSNQDVHSLSLSLPIL
jgi:drug/metabolite transporter (DMT)-like permease